MSALERRDACPDCGVLIGKNHDRGCDIRLCLWIGFQRLSCPASGHVTVYRHGVPVVPKVEPGHDCGVDVWTGWIPGALQAAALDMWCRWSGAGWVPCGPEHPDARPDLNRLTTECDWDRERRQWLRGVEVSDGVG